MELSEVIGFLIIILVVASPVIKKILEDGRKKKIPPEQSEKKVKRSKVQVDVVKDFLKSLDISFDEEESKVVKPPPPPMLKEEILTKEELRKRKFHFEGKLEGYHQKSEIENRHIKSNISEDLNLGDIKIGNLEKFLNQEYQESVEEESLISLEIATLQEPRNLLLMHEIFSSPMALRMEEQFRG